METEQKFEEGNGQRSGSHSERRWLRWLIIPVVVISLSAGAVFFLYPGISQAAAIPGIGGWFGDGNGRGHGNAYLAEALGVSDEELDAAQSEAQTLRLQAMLENGDITQEEFDQIMAQRALGEYLRDRMQTMFEETIQEAVADGVITQEQADQFLSGEWQGLRGFGLEAGPGFGGPRGRHGMRGGWDDFGPRGDRMAPPQSDSGDNGSGESNSGESGS